MRSAAAIPPTSSCCPADTARDRGDRARCATSTACRSCLRGAGTGYTGGAVPTRGGVVLSLERLNRILEIDESNLLAVVEPTSSPATCRSGRSASACSIRRIRRACESSSIGGNVAECAGGPRAFKYGTTKRYVLALEAVLPTGEIIQTGEGGEERRRLRPDAAAGRLGRHARDHHRRSRCGWFRSRRRRPRSSRRFPNIERRRRRR